MGTGNRYCEGTGCYKVQSEHLEKFLAVSGMHAMRLLMGRSLLLQEKVPGPAHRARNALLYLQLENKDLVRPEVLDLISMAGLDSLPPL